MKKAVLTLFFVPMFALACRGRGVDMPKSPFPGDNYTPIGMESAFNEKLNPLDEEGKEYSNLRNTIVNYKEQADIITTKYTRKREHRNLKHAYFGDQEQNLCSYVSQEVNGGYYLNSDDEDDIVSVDKNYEVNKRQTLSGGIKTSSSQVETYDSTDLSDLSLNNIETYTEVKSTKINQEKAEVVETPGITYDSKVFLLTPFATYISQHFNDIGFDLFGEDNNAVYGKFNDGRYLIKEARSFYDEYPTLGHKYKAVKNYFYEGVLTKVGQTENLGFTSFRFYSELLILSEAADSEDVPVLYLEHPMLVEYDEYKYEISYEPLGAFDRGKIPIPTKL
ncbi:MAG: hypothetical protein MJ206_02330 [Bacilli bacterium]|nr:hypothetical protein [Bacilli bacterium]